MTDTFKEIGSLFGREGAGAGFAKQTDKESFTYAFAWPEGDTWATLTGYLNLDEQPEEYVRRVLQDGGFRSDWDNPDYDPIGDFKETAGDEYRIPLLKVLLREQLASRYEVANHFSTMNRARVELSAFIQNEGGAPLPEDALGTPEEQGIRAMLIATGEPPREMTLLPDKNGSTLKPLQALVGGNIETFDIAFGEGVSLYVNEEGLFTCPPKPKGFYPSTVRVRHPHGLTLEQIKRLPELLERPVVLMDSDRDDTMIAVLADVDEDGFPLIAALRPGGNAVSEGRSVGGTIVCSFYGKPENYFRFKMQQMPQRVLYQDIEKGRELDARAKLQLFGGNIASPDLDRRIIRPPECIVKLRADTPQMETHGRETSRVRRESRDMASGRAALDAGRRAETARVTERHIDSNLK